MKKALVLILVLQLLDLSAQFRRGGGDLQFFIIKDEPGPTANYGQLVSMNMSIKDATGKFIKNTFKDQKPLLFPVKHSLYDGDIYEAVTMLSKGDSAHFLLTADSMYAKVFHQDMPKELKKGSNLEVVIKVYDIFNQKDRLDELKKDNEVTLNAQEIDRRKKEEDQIKKYIASSGMEFTKTPSGIYFVVLSEGKGSKIGKNGLTAVINYSGFFMDGTSFETTYNEDGIGRPAHFVIGKEEVIKGWDEILVGKKEGDQFKCIIPSHLAFGNRAKGSVIPANSVLIFDIDVAGIR